MFEHENRRQLTFTNKWPQIMPIKPNTLVVAGLYYTGQSVWTICFSCGIGIKNLLPHDDVILIHLKASINCKFLRLLPDYDILTTIMHDTDTTDKIFTPRDRHFLAPISKLKGMEEDLDHLKKKYRSTLELAEKTIKKLKLQSKTTKKVNFG